MAEYFHGTGTRKLVPDNRPHENPSIREISNTEGYLRRKVRKVQRTRSKVLLYIILVSVPVKYPAMELQELHTRGRGRVSPYPYPGEYSAMRLGGETTPNFLDQAKSGCMDISECHTFPGSSAGVYITLPTALTPPQLRSCSWTASLSTAWLVTKCS